MRAGRPARRPRLAPTVTRVHALVDHFPNTSVIGVRFLFGMRSVVPAIIGAGNMRWAKFLLLDALADVLWSRCWTTAGHALGAAALALLSAIGDAGRWILFAIAGIVIAAVVARRRCRRKFAALLPPPAERGTVKPTSRQSSHPYSGCNTSSQSMTNGPSLVRDEWRRRL